MAGYGIPDFLTVGLSRSIYIRMINSDWLPWSIDDASTMKADRGIGMLDVQLSGQEIKDRYALALPDLQCCRRYCMHLEERGAFMSIILLTRNNFEAQFGKDATHRTIATLALTGRPYLYLFALIQE